MLLFRLLTAFRLLLHTPKKQTKCTCGRNPKSDGKACSSLRCACVRGSKECTRSCVCKGCSNKYGVRPLPSTTRRRQSYDTQQHPLRGRPCDEFMADTGQTTTDGNLTSFEILLLKSIVIHFILHGLELSVENIFNVYKRIFCISVGYDSVVFPIFERSRQYIQRFLAKMHSSLQLLKFKFS